MEGQPEHPADEIRRLREELEKGALERERTKNELKQSEVRKAAILDSALDCIVTIDHEGRITEFNQAAEHTFGYRREEVFGMHLADIIIPPSLREAHRSGLARYLATGEQRVIGRRLEMMAVHADGREFPVELAITRIPLEGPPSFTGFLRDITERKRAELKLRESEFNLRQLTETIPEMLWSATPEGMIDYCNARMLDYTGFSAERNHRQRMDQAYFIRTMLMRRFECGCPVLRPDRHTRLRFASSTLPSAATDGA